MTRAQDFWSRRRAQVEAEAAAEREAEEAREQAARDAALEEVPEAELLAELGLPAPETLKPGDDFTAFMAKAVPEAIRRRALRVLWKSNPVLANVDMLVDYGEDFTDSATVIPNLQTAYQVGKGMLRHVEEMARQAEAEARRLEEGEKEPEEVTETDAPQEPEPEEMVAQKATDQQTILASQEALDQDEESAPPKPRRMKFRIEESA